MRVRMLKTCGRAFAIPGFDRIPESCYNCWERSQPDDSGFSRGDGRGILSGKDGVQDENGV